MVVMKRSRALKKQCPFTFCQPHSFSKHDPPVELTNYECIADDCMAWVTTSEEEKEGYCQMMSR